MKKTYSFETLSEFASALETCKASSPDGSTMPVKEALSRVVEMIQTVDKNRKKIVLVGNGGSAAIASHIAVDLWKNGGIRATAFNDSSLLTCVANDYSYADVFAKPIEMFCDKGDVVIAISSSGKSPNIHNAVSAAENIGCEVVTLSGFKADNQLRSRGEINFYLASDSYGVVEVGHLLLIHAIVDEAIRQKKSNPTLVRSPKSEVRSPKKAAR